MKTQPERLGAKMTETHFTSIMPQSAGIEPKVADLWIEKLNDTDTVWWRWSGRYWVHDDDNITRPPESKSQAVPQ